jgi:hypothetical protein
VLSGATVRSVHKRFQSLRAALASEPAGHEIKVGIASLTPDDSAAELIDRADADCN